MLLCRLFVLVLSAFALEAVRAPTPARAMGETMLENFFARWQDWNRGRTHLLHFLLLFLSEPRVGSILYVFVRVQFIVSSITCLEWFTSARDNIGTYGALIA